MPGGLDGNGIYIFTESDLSSPISSTLNLGQTATSTAIGKLASHPSGRWGLAIAQSITTGVFTLLGAGTAFSGEVDASKFTNVAGAVTVNEAGWYDVQAHVIHGSNATGRRVVIITKNGTFSGSTITAGGVNIATDGRSAMSGGETITDLRARPIQLAVGDVIRCYVFQDSGSTLSTPPGGATSYLGETSLLVRKVTP